MFSVSDILKGGPNKSSKSYCLSSTNQTKVPHRSRMKCTQIVEVDRILDLKASTSDNEEDEEIVTDKERLLIQKHPLYPVLKVLF